MTSATQDQPAPVSSAQPAVWDLVQADIAQRISRASALGHKQTAEEKAVFDRLTADMQARDALGAQHYGTRLQPFNGRDSLADLYQEILDGVVYARQALVDGGLGEDAHDVLESEVYLGLLGLALMVCALVNDRAGTPLGQAIREAVA